MAKSSARLTLVTPLLRDAGGIAPVIAAACAAGDVASVLLRLAPAEERALINLVKALAPGAQETGAAVVIAIEGEGADLATVAARGGADGVHVVAGGDDGLARLADLRERLHDRIVGAGGLRTRDDAMNAGEVRADYLMFGGARPDGTHPSIEAVADRAAWWAEIFETPCIAVAPSAADIEALARTGVEFVGLDLTPFTEARDAAAAVETAVALLGTIEVGA